MLKIIRKIMKLKMLKIKKKKKMKMLIIMIIIMLKKKKKKMLIIMKDWKPLRLIRMILKKKINYCIEFVYR